MPLTAVQTGKRLSEANALTADRTDVISSRGGSFMCVKE